MVTPGQPAPAFELETVEDGEVSTATLDDFEGNWLVLFSFPDAFSPVCPTEIQAFSKHLPTLQEAGAEVLGVSTNTTKDLSKWAEENAPEGLGYPLASDGNGSLAEELGVKNPKNGTYFRSTTIVNPEGEIVYFDTHINPMARSVQNVVRNVQGLQAFTEDGELCPADWTLGDDFIQT